MKASDLYAILAKMTPAERENTRIILSADAEGNEFSPMAEASKERGANVHLSRVTNTLRREVEAGPVLVLWPM